MFLPTIYLGMPLGAKSNSKDIWNGVIEKCEKKLINWKSQYLSLDNRFILIYSVGCIKTYMIRYFVLVNTIIGGHAVGRLPVLWFSGKNAGCGMLVRHTLQVQTYNR